MLCAVVSDNPTAPSHARWFSSGRWTRNPIRHRHFRAAALAGVLTSPAGRKQTTPSRKWMCARNSKNYSGRCVDQKFARSSFVPCLLSPRIGLAPDLKRIAADPLCGPPHVREIRHEGRRIARRQGLPGGHELAHAAAIDRHRRRAPVQRRRSALLRVFPAQSKFHCCPQCIRQATRVPCR